MTELLPPEPGERCALCDRRRNKPRQATTPDSRSVKAGKLPHDRAESLEDALDALQAVVGADPESYPRGTLLEAMVVVAGLHHREELTAFFAEYRDALSEQVQTSEAA